MLKLLDERRSPANVLRAVAAPIVEIDQEVRFWSQRMLAVMRTGRALGLAAPQLGISRRLICVMPHPMGLMFMVNPELEWISAEKATAPEGCLSLPGRTVMVTRPQRCRVVFTDLSGEEQVLRAEGLQARIVQHEIDHLEGKLIA